MDSDSLAPEDPIPKLLLEPELTWVNNVSSTFIFILRRVKTWNKCTLCDTDQRWEKSSLKRAINYGLLFGWCHPAQP